MDYQIVNTQLEKADRIIENIAFIEEKLQSSKLSDNKREKLNWIKKHLEEVVLPRCHQSVYLH